MSDNNAKVIEAWNTILFDKFKRFQHLLIDGLAAHSNELLGRGIHAPGMAVLDVGCGFGDSTLKIAQTVGPSGRAVGVDCASNFIAEAQSSLQAGPSNAEFFVADVQLDDLRGPYDAAFARFGTMFFNSPGAALRNIKRALRPGAPFRQIVWRKREDNPWLYEAELCVKQILPVISHEETDQVHCGPGPFSMAGPDLVSSMLHASGYRNVSFERFDADICIGRDLDEAVEFAMALGPAGEVVRLAGEVGVSKTPEVRAALRRVLEPFLRNDGVWGPSSVWFVTAVAV